jgi:TATA-binding protein-associated factor Taf7
MARGWESKSVEDQMEEAKGRADLQDERTTPLESRLLQQKVESLRQSRSRLLQQLERARNPAHREVLLKGLQAVEREIEDISPTGDPGP